MKYACIAVAGLVITLSACATSEKVNPVAIGDNKLSCDQLKGEFAKLDQAQKDINEKKSVNGTNVVSAVFWLPGLAYTFYDAGQATDAVSQRRAHLTEIYNKKNCN